MVALRSGVYPVFLHRPGYLIHAKEQERKQRRSVLVSKQGISRIELRNVVGAIIGRQRDPTQDDLDMRPRQSRDDLVEVRPRVRNRQPAQSIIPAKRDNNHSWPERKNVFQPLDAVFSSVAAHARVNDTVTVAASIEFALQKVGIALAGVRAKPRRKAVSESHDDGPSICRACVRFSRRRFWLARNSWLVLIRSSRQWRGLARPATGKR